MARIVILDDEERLLRTLARFVGHEGHEIVTGTRFADVERELYPGQFDLLLTDIVMPGTDGMAVLREVVQVRECHEPVVLVTGQPSLDTASEAVRSGAFDYISKPITKGRLLEVVTRGLRHVELLRERDRAIATEMDVLRNLAQLGESASVLSHEIRTPITSLRHALRAVGEKLGLSDQQIVEEHIKNLEHIEGLLNSALSLVRPLPLDRRAVRLTRVVQDALTTLRGLPVAERLSVTVEVPEDLVVDIDPALFQDALINLLRNAAEAGSGEVHATVRGAVVGEGGSAWTVEVTDDGPGVPRDKRGEIFRPFRSFKNGGTGIGLAFVRKVVESHDGTIDLLDRADRADLDGLGACFRIRMPAATRPIGNLETDAVGLRRQHD